MDDILAYFRAVAEGMPDIPNWHEWREQHDDVLRREFGRTRYLKLKVHPLEEIRAILKESRIEHATVGRLPLA